MQKNIELIMQYVKNQRKCAKHSIGYMIGSMHFHSTYNLFCDTYKRSEVIAEFERLIQEEKYYNRVIQLNTIKQLINQ